MESNDAQLTLHDQLLTWFATHKNEVIWGTTAVVVIGLIVGTVIHFRNAKEQNANEALSKVFNSGAPAGSPAEALLKVASDYPGTAAGIRAQLMGAEGLFAEGKYADAKTLFDKFLKEHRDTPFAAQASFGVAVCLDAQNQTNEAIAAYNDVLKRHPNDNVSSRTKLALARYYEAQNKLAQAKDFYEDLLRTFGNNSPLGQEASIHMQGLYVRHPELFQPKTPTPAIVPATTTATSTAPAITIVPAAATNKP